MNFDPIAPYYLRTRQKKTDALTALARGIVQEDLAAHLGDNTKIKVFEPGCGTGFFMQAFLQADPRVVAEGWDISGRMLVEATRRLDAPLHGLANDRFILSTQDVFTGRLPASHLASTHLFLHLLPNWQDALDRVLSIDGLVAYVHFFEDCDYFSAVTGHPTLLPDDHPIPILGEVLKAELGRPNKPFSTPGPYLPSHVLRYVRENHPDFRLAAVRMASWNWPYTLKDFLSGLVHKVMSTYYVDDHTAVSRVIDKLTRRFRQIRHKVVVPHDMWAFVLVKNLDAVAVPHFALQGKRTDYDEAIHHPQKVRTWEDVYRAFDDVLCVALANSGADVFATSASAFYSTKNDRLVAWWSRFPRAEVATWYERVRKRAKDNEDISPTRFVQKRFGMIRPPPTFRLEFDKSAQTVSLSLLDPSASVSRYPSLKRLKEQPHRFPMATFEIMNEFHDLWSVYSPRDDVRTCLIQPVSPPEEEKQPGVIFIAGAGVGKAQQHLSSVQNALGLFARNRLRTPSQEIASSLQHTILTGCCTSIDSLSRRDNQDNYRKLFHDDVAHLVSQILNTDNRSRIKKHLEQEVISRIIRGVEEYHYYLNSGSVSYLPKSLSTALKPLQCRLLLCKLEAERHKDNFNPLGVLLALLRKFRHDDDSALLTLTPLFECLGSYWKVSSDDQARFRRVLDNFNFPRDVNTSPSWGILGLRAMSSIYDIVREERRQRLSFQVIVSPPTHSHTSPLERLEHLSRADSIWVEVESPDTGWVDQYDGKPTNKRRPLEDAISRTKCERFVEVCQPGETARQRLDSRMRDMPTPAVGICTDHHRIVYRFKLYGRSNQTRST